MTDLHSPTGTAENQSIARRKFLVGLGAGSALLVLDTARSQRAAAASSDGPLTAYVGLIPPAGRVQPQWASADQACQDGTLAPFISTGDSVHLANLGDAGKVGILKSKVFTAPASLSFWLAGQDGPAGTPDLNTNFVELLDAATGQVLQKAPVPRNDTAQQVTWDLSSIAGTQVYLEVIDGNDTGDWAWISFGRLDPAVVAMPTANGQPIPSDWTPEPLPPGSQSVDGVPFLTGTFWAASAAEGSTFTMPAYGIQA
ncbi:MAG: hypothetical protein J2P17_22805, partial [Mycobacterium sp.]|nr:hypothetical protein [Mycobacterium sp.]